MADTNINTSQSTFPEDHEISPKRARTDNNFETDCDSEPILKEFQAFCSKVRKRTEESFEIKSKQLELQLQVSAETIAQLQGDLAREKSEKQEACRAQAVAEEKLLQLTIILERQYNELAPLMTHSSSDGIPAASRSQEELQTSVPVGKPSDTDSTSLDRSNPKNIRLKEARVIIQTMTPDIITHKQREALEARAKRAGELEEELRVAKDTISSLHEALREQESTMGKKDQAGELQEEGGTLQNYSLDGDDIGDSFNVEDSPSEASEETYAPLNDRSENDERSEVLGNAEQHQDDPRILIGKKYPFFVSGRRFLKIHWDREIRREEDCKWVCETCSHELKSKQQIKDHVWTVHYEGNFQCPHCIDPSNIFRGRTSLMKHIKRKHK